ncbi:hypothetical protein HPP92_023662 [Vanilla planifolia]|uniref:Pentatricopeptide repeat-containing protein n=1 Tax=Vanilla planifolia TaxID=51239 RepID=A0A835PTS8_VANPL|nr:hypothetical protein HPP92_023662 [Vanilla planifolia]
MMDAAMKIFADMEEKGMKPDAYTYNVIICALLEAGRTEEANNMLSKLSSSEKLRLNFSSLFPGDVSKEESEKMQKRNFSENTEEDQKCSISETYSAQINDLCNKGQFKEAKLVLEEMIQKDVPIKSSNYITLMDGFIKRQKRMGKGPG